MVYKRKLFYAPGLISLTGLFIFFIFSKEKITPKSYTTLNLNVPRDRNSNDWPPIEYFSIEFLEKIIRNKKQLKLNLDSNKMTNQKKIELMKYEAQKIKYTQDTNTVIRVSFSDISYGEFVQLLDLCYLDNHKRFALLKNSFVIFGETPPKIKQDDDSIPMIMCGTGRIMNENYKMQEAEEKKIENGFLYKKRKYCSIYRLAVFNTQLYLL